MAPELPQMLSTWGAGGFHGQEREGELGPQLPPLVCWCAAPEELVLVAVQPALALGSAQGWLLAGLTLQ